MKYKFHNVYFTEKQKIQVLEFAEGRNWTVSDCIQSLVEKEWKVSFSWSAFNNSVQLSLTKADKEHMFYGWILCFLHSDVHTLCKIMLWLHAEGLDFIELPPGEKQDTDW